MAGVSFSELILLFVIGLLILGPERMPRVASQIGRWVGKARRTANQLRYQLEREIALSDIEANKKKNPPKAKSPSTADADTKASEQSTGATSASAAGDSVSGNPASTGSSSDDASVSNESISAGTATSDAVNHDGASGTEKNKPTPSSVGAQAPGNDSEQA